MNSSNNDTTIGKKGLGVFDYDAFTAHVILPINVDRKKYIDDCYRKGTVFIRSVDNQFEKNVQIDRGSIHYINFPLKVNEYGTAVYCLRDQLYRKSKVVAIIQNENEDPIITEEKQFRIFKSNFKNFVDLDLKGLKGSFSLVCNSDNASEVSTVKVGNSQNKAVLNLEVQGEINVLADGKISVQSFSGLKLAVGDGDKNNSLIEISESGDILLKDQNENSVNLTSDGLVIKNNNGEFSLQKSSFVMKNSTEDMKSLLSDFFKTISQAQVLTTNGPAPLMPTTILQIEELTQRINLLFK